MKKIQDILETLRTKLHLSVEINEVEQSLASIPLALKQQYGLYPMKIEGVSFVGVCIQDLEKRSLKKHLKFFEERINIPIILIIENLTSSSKRYLIENRISFVTDKTVYLPRILVYLDDMLEQKTVLTTKKKLSKLAQQLMIMAVVEKKNILDSVYLIEKFHVSKMSASRVLNELEAAGLVIVKRDGRKKYYILHISSLDALLGVMHTPVVQTIYLDLPFPADLSMVCRSGYDALAYYADITSQEHEIAIEKGVFEQYQREEELPIYEMAFEQHFVKVELWRYPPVACQSGVVDPFSLYLLLQSEVEDERTRNALGQLYAKLERMINDTRS